MTDSTRAALESLRIDRHELPPRRRFPRTTGPLGLAVVVLLSSVWAMQQRSDPVPSLEIQSARAEAPLANDAPILNATGYLVATRRVEVAARVIGKVTWIGVDRGDKVHAGDVLVRLEDAEYRAHVQQAAGQLAAIEARLARALHGSRTEEIERARAELDAAVADLDYVRATLERTTRLVEKQIASAQALDEARARFETQRNRVAALEQTYKLVQLGLRPEDIDALRGELHQARGVLAHAEANLGNTIIRAPIAGTILERGVEVGELVTTSFVGDRGAKGYVVALADLSVLDVEVDISQSDFARLSLGQPAVITTEAFPDRRHAGVLREIAPEANRQRGTVQARVRVEAPDVALRPEMTAVVTFTAPQSVSQSSAPPVLTIPASAARNGAVFVLHDDGRAVQRQVETRSYGADRLLVKGLQPGDRVIVNPPPQLQQGDRVRAKE